jgi:hypothetical protein
MKKNASAKIISPYFDRVLASLGILTGREDLVSE